MSNVEIDFSVYESRGAREYSVFLFPEDYTGNRLTHKISSWALDRAGQKRYRDFEYNPLEGPTLPAELEDIYKRFGGKRKFFRKGARIMDFGSGAGRAVYDFARNRNIEVIGLDPVYAERPPEYSDRGLFVGGKGQDMPFADDTFTGVVACESFPRHVVNFHTAEQTVKELTRVSRPDAVFRGTMKLFPGERLVYDETDEVTFEVDKELAIKSLFRHYGWESYYSKQGLIITHLVNKPSKFEKIPVQIKG